MANKKYQSNLQLTQMLLNFISVCVCAGGRGGGGWGECIILMRHSRTVFNQSNHKVFLNFSVSLFISLISALNLPHQYVADNKLQHRFLILTNFE